MFKKIFIANLLIILLFFVTGCEDSNKKNDNKQKDGAVQKLLTVGTSADYPPFEFMRDGEIVGFDIDLAKAIADKLNRQINIKEMPFYSLLPALQKGEIDIALSGITANVERSENMEFSAQYYQSKFSLLILGEHKTNQSISIDGKIIGTQTGSAMYQWLVDQKKAGLKVDIITMDRTLDLVEDLKSGRIDGVLLDDKVAQDIVKSATVPMTVLAMDSVQMDFSEPYNINKFSLIVMKESGLKKPILLPEMKVGVKTGSEMYDWLLKQKNYGLKINIITFDETLDLAQALKDKKIDAILLDDGTANSIINNDLIGGYEMRKLVMNNVLIDGFVVGLKKENPLVSDINIALKSLKNDGTLDKLKEKWGV